MSIIEGTMHITKAIFLGLLLTLGVAITWYDISYVQILYLIIAMVSMISLYLAQFLAQVVDAHQTVIAMLAYHLFGDITIDEMHDELDKMADKMDETKEVD